MLEYSYYLILHLRRTSWVSIVASIPSCEGIDAHGTVKLHKHHKQINGLTAPAVTVTHGWVGVTVTHGWVDRCNGLTAGSTGVTVTRRGRPV
eukprot:3625952-Prymnesium_polylepis.1